MFPVLGPLIRLGLLSRTSSRTSALRHRLFPKSQAPSSRRAPVLPVPLSTLAPSIVGTRSLIGTNEGLTTGSLPWGRKRSAAESELPANSGSRAQSKPKTKGVSFEMEEAAAPELPTLPEVNEPVEASDVPPAPGPTADKPVVEIIKRSGVPEDKSALVNLPARTHMVWSAVEKGMVRVRAKAKQHLPRPRA